MKFFVLLTACFPCCWKVESRQWPGRNNSWTEYFRTHAEAQTECDRRNEKETTP